MREEIKVIEKMVVDMMEHYKISPEYAVKIVLERITSETIEWLKA